jgi:hypothetical protein
MKFARFFITFLLAHTKIAVLFSIDLDNKIVGKQPNPHQHQSMRPVNIILRYKMQRKIFFDRMVIK